MSVDQYWLYLFVAIIFGVLGTTSLKLSHGLRKWKPALCLFIFYSISFVALTLAIKGIDVSIVYAVWSGVGIILMTIIGIAIFNESMSVPKVISLFLIVIGILGIYLLDVFQAFRI